MVQDLVEDVTLKLKSMNLKLVTAESCTGGMLAAAITERPGSSEVFERGFITYSNEAKMDLLGVPEETLRKHGAVSAQTALAMTKGALKNSRARLAVAITGIAGPGGGTDEKPVGLVYIGYGYKEEGIAHSAEHFFEGDRSDIRQQAMDEALQHLLKFMDTLA